MKQIILLALAIALAACGSAAKTETHTDHAHGDEHQHEAGHDHADHEGEDHATHDHAAEAKPVVGEYEHKHDGAITLSQCQADELGVTYATISAVPFVGAVKVSGVVEPASSENVAVIAPAGAVVDFAMLNMTAGTKVYAGATLFILKGAKMVSNNLTDKIKLSEAQYIAAKEEFGRLFEAAKSQIVTPAQLDAARINVIKTEQDYIGLSGATQVKSPITGHITQIDVKKGAFVDEGAPLVTITSSRKIVVRADVPANYFDLLPQINSANFITPYNGKTYSIKELGGKLLSKANAVTEGGYTIPVRFVVGNVENVATGTALEVYLTLQPKKDVISLPVAALTEEQGAFYVYKKVCKESYEKVLVKLGDSNGKQVQVLSGVKIGDVIVTKGAYFVRLAAASSSIPHGHAH